MAYLTSSERFFYYHAPVPKSATIAHSYEEARTDNARRLADAEHWAASKGYQHAWIAHHHNNEADTITLECVLYNPAEDSVILARHNPVDFHNGPDTVYTVIQHRVIEAQVSLRALEDSFFSKEHQHG